MLDILWYSNTWRIQHANHKMNEVDGSIFAHSQTWVAHPALFAKLSGWMVNKEVFVSLVCVEWIASCVLEPRVFPKLAFSLENA